MKNRRSSLSIFMTLAIALSLALLSGNNALAVEFEGNGTTDFPYLIRTVEQLENVGLNSNYKLMNDLELESVPRTNSIIKGYSPIQGIYFGFRGIFDGNGHTIRGLNIQSAYGGSLFDFVEGGTIKNLTLEDPIINASSASNTSALCIRSENSTILNCYIINGTITGYGNVGALIADSDGDRIEQCFSSSNVMSTKGIAGGLVGVANNGTIDQSCAIGEVKARTFAGGLVGKEDEPVKINNCYAIGDIECPNGMSGIGNAVHIKNSYSATTSDIVDKWVLPKTEYVCNIYFDSSLLDLDSPEEQARTTGQMHQKLNYPGWNFEKVWYIEEGEDYPRLLFQKEIDGLYKGPLTITMNQTKQLKLSTHEVGEGKQYVWTSSDPEIATVDKDGLVSAQHEGTTIITVRTTDHSYSEDICVTVANGDSV